MKKVWTHPKFKKKTWTGSYHKVDLKGGLTERVFILVSNKSEKTGSYMKVSFESHQAAKAAGWRAV